MAERIEDYALIGDCETAALVGRGGSIDWLCWPRFDSDACFAALLGDESHGRWLIAPADPAVRVSRRYREDTLVLETTFETAEGVVELIDFMPARDGGANLARLVRGVRGRVAMRTELTIRFGYGRTTPWVSRMDDGALRAIAGPDMLVLRTPAELRGENMHTVGDFVVEAGQAVPFTCSYGPSHLPIPPAFDVETALEDCCEFWRSWIARGTVNGPWAKLIKRSLITLKALTYAPTGGLVAAPTASLPEQFGGVRNWDYRYCWIRDATLTLLALMNAGYYGEAKAWRDWLLRAAAGAPEELQIMYGIGGERRLMEWSPTWLPGYQGAAPVRIGNAAHEQFQLDVYGELVDALYQARCGGLESDIDARAMVGILLKHIGNVWEKPDEGIWESRGGPQHFTFSKVMAWVAVDRAVKSVEQFGVPGAADDWRALRDRIHADICARGFDQAKNSFVQAYGGTALDASLLQIASLGFVAADDPRFIGTVQAIERELLCDGFVMRYDTGVTEDGLPAGENAFLACSFWLVDAYVLMGRRGDAQQLFGRLASLCNDLGLLAEEYDPTTGRHAGNFPQAFSHVGLINAAFNLTRSDKPTEQRAGSGAPPETRPPGPQADAGSGSLEIEG